jgi:hypothetical protein
MGCRVILTTIRRLATIDLRMFISRIMIRRMHFVWRRRVPSIRRHHHRITGWRVWRVRRMTKTWRRRTIWIIRGSRMFFWFILMLFKKLYLDFFPVPVINIVISLVIISISIIIFTARVNRRIISIRIYVIGSAFIPNIRNRKLTSYYELLF